MKDKKLRERLFGYQNIKCLNTDAIHGILGRCLPNGCAKIIKCDVCKCLLYKQDAVEGKEEIKKRFKSGIIINGEWMEKYIYTPYYCQKCKPKELKKSKK